MDEIEPFARHVPYHVAVGNHGGSAGSKQPQQHPLHACMPPQLRCVMLPSDLLGGRVAAALQKLLSQKLLHCPAQRRHTSCGLRVIAPAPATGDDAECWVHG
jgi:hypothetical protein